MGGWIGLVDCYTQIDREDIIRNGLAFFRRRLALYLANLMQVLEH